MNRLKELREKSNIKQSDLAKTLNVSQGTLSNWERGVHDPSSTDLSKLAKILNTSVDNLLGEEPKIDNLPYDEETLKAIQEAKDRPELQELLKLGKNATKEDVEKTIEILKVLKKDNSK